MDDPKWDTENDAHKTFMASSKVKFKSKTPFYRRQSAYYKERGVP
jgi:hypothetical protein